jgi:quinate/shikimate dehydrogenase (NAD+)
VTAAVRVGLVGREILASRSPWLHEREALAQELALRYELVDFTARGLADADLPRMLAELGAAGFAGVNVTYPFKQAVLPLLTRLSPEAERIGAVNTVLFRGEERIGFNTDVTGFAEAVRAELSGARLATVVQLGAGGGGSATAFALLELGTRRLTLVDTDAGRAAALCARLARAFHGREIVVGGANEVPAIVTASDGIVNATPLGMAKSPGTAVPPQLLEPRHWVADIVYFPLETELLRAAAAKGCRVLDGSAMAVGQAAAAFEIFTERRADRVRMLEAFHAFPPPPLR